MKQDTEEEKARLIEEQKRLKEEAEEDKAEKDNKSFIQENAHVITKKPSYKWQNRVNRMFNYIEEI